MENKEKYTVNDSASWGGSRNGAGRKLKKVRKTINFYASSDEEDILNTIFAAKRDKIDFSIYDPNGLLRAGIEKIELWIEQQKRDEEQFRALTSRKSKPKIK